MRPSAAKAEALIDEALAIDPTHPLAIHLYIHIAEASDPRR
jgi:Tfp pilus assembly protein PilF